MREILFRGKLSDEGDWIEGCYIQSVVKNSPFAYITPSFPNTPRQVYSITVGQYTGLTDKNGKKIFEGDIFVHPRCPKYKYVVTWEADTASFSWFNDDMGFNNEEIEVIGNIDDNPELLKGR